MYASIDCNGALELEIGIEAPPSVSSRLQLCHRGALNPKPLENLQDPMYTEASIRQEPILCTRERGECVGLFSYPFLRIGVHFAKCGTDSAPRLHGPAETGRAPKGPTCVSMQIPTYGSESYMTPKCGSLSVHQWHPVQPLCSTPASTLSSTYTVSFIAISYLPNRNSSAFQAKKLHLE